MGLFSHFSAGSDIVTNFFQFLNFGEISISSKKVFQHRLQEVLYTIYLPMILDFTLIEHRGFMEAELGRNFEYKMSETTYGLDLKEPIDTRC